MRIKHWMDLRRLCRMRAMTTARTCVHAQINSYVWVVFLCNAQPFNCQFFFKKRKERKRASVRRHNMMRVDTSSSCCFFSSSSHWYPLYQAPHWDTNCGFVWISAFLTFSKTKRNILPISRAFNRVISVARWSHFYVTSGSYFMWKQMCYSLSLTGQIEDEASPFIEPLDLC